MANEFILLTLSNEIIDGKANAEASAVRINTNAGFKIPNSYQPLKLDYALIAELQALSAQTIAHFHSK